MIIDTIENAGKYVALHTRFAEAFAFINNTDLAQEETGIKTISEGLKSIISDGPGKTQEAALLKFECHNQNIDIQYCIRGNETFGWKPRNFCKNPKGEFNEEKDILFYDDVPDTYFSLHDGQFVIFYPEDVHAPMIGEGVIRKVVMKVKI